MELKEGLDSWRQHDSFNPFFPDWPTTWPSGVNMNLIPSLCMSHPNLWRTKIHGICTPLIKKSTVHIMFISAETASTYCYIHKPHLFLCFPLQKFTKSNPIILCSNTQEAQGALAQGGDGGGRTWYQHWHTLPNEIKVVRSYREQLTHLPSHGHIQQASYSNVSIPLADSINNKIDILESRDLRKSLLF